MAWVKIDDGFARHPKVLAAGATAAHLFVAALCHCNQYLTDGFVAEAVAPTLLPPGGAWQGAADALVRVGLWEAVDGGWQVHDYLDYQPSREEVLQEREQKRAAGRAGGRSSARSRRRATDDREARACQSASEVSEAEAKQNPSTCFVSASPSASEIPNPRPVPVPVPEPGTMGTSSGTPNGVPTEAAAASATPVAPDASEPAPDGPPDAPGGPEAEVRPYWEQFRPEDYLVRDFCQILDLRAPQQVKDARAFARIGGLVKLVGPGLVAEALLSLDVRHSREPFANPVDAFAYLKATAQKQRDAIAEREARAAAPPPPEPPRQQTLMDICDENTRIAEEEGLPAWRWEEARRRRRERETAAKSAT